MEQYLIDDYNVIEDTKYLKTEEDIKEYFGDLAYDYLDCGQGYYTDEYSWICKIGEKFYDVYVSATIMSAKQDIGDRLYWIESIDTIEYNETGKPLPKEKQKITYTFTISNEKLISLNSFLKEKKIKYKISEELCK